MLARLATASRTWMRLPRRALSSTSSKPSTRDAADALRNPGPPEWRAKIGSSSSSSSSSMASKLVPAGGSRNLALIVLAGTSFALAVRISRESQVRIEMQEQVETLQAANEKLEARQQALATLFAFKKAQVLEVVKQERPALVGKVEEAFQRTP